MKIVAIAGSIAEESYNRQLLMFISEHFYAQADIELLNISDIPMFSEDTDQSESVAIQYLAHKIENADGVILATPEHNHTTTPAMKNIIEWLSYRVHPFSNKPVLILGASWDVQGSSRAQLALRQILESPGVDALVMPGDEFLLSNARDAFDEFGQLKDQQTVVYLDTVIHKFTKWITALSALQEKSSSAPWRREDLSAGHPTDTTVDIADSDDWVEQAAEKVHAVSGGQYVQLDRGLLTVDQLNWFLNSIPMELTYMDDNDQFIYYNHVLDHDDMLAPRYPKQVGDSAEQVHPPHAREHVQQVIWALRKHDTDLVAMPVPGNIVNEKYIMHFYRAMHDEDGRYRGVNEWVLDVWPVVADYLKSTGQLLARDPSATPDATTGASEHAATKTGSKPSSTASGPQHLPATSTPTPAPDATTGASEHAV